MKPLHSLRMLALTASLTASLCIAPLASQARTPDDQLVIGMSMSNLLSLDPAAATGLDVAEIGANLYDTLIELDPKDTTHVVPGLAQSWQVSDDKRSITFNLQKGVKFQSGNLLTAEDVAWSLQRVVKLNLAQATVWKTYGFTAENAEKYMRAQDMFTFVLELPNQTIPRLVMDTIATTTGGMILDRKKVLENEKNGDMGAAWLTTHAAGSGAFTLDEWRAKDVMLLSRFEGYWRGPAKLRRLVMRHMTESQTLRLMLERGDIDIASGMTVPDIEALKKSPDLSVQSVQHGTLYYVGMSVKDPKFADKRVRLAIRNLIDYKGINEAVMLDYGIPHQRPVSIGTKATLPDPGYKLNVEAAKKLLAEAGYKNGFKTTIRVLADQPFITVATSLQATLAKAGIEASVLPGTGNQVYGAMRDRNFEMIVGRGGGGSEPHPHAALRSLTYNPDNRDEAKLVNFQGWRTSFVSPEINTLLQKAESEQDEKKQMAMYQDVQKIYEKEVGPIMVFSQMVDTILMRKDVTNFVGHPSNTTRYHDVYKRR